MFLTWFACQKDQNTQTGPNKVPAYTVWKIDLVLYVSLDLTWISQLDQVVNILGTEDMQKIELKSHGGLSN